MNCGLVSKGTMIDEFEVGNGVDSDSVCILQVANVGCDD